MIAALLLATATPDPGALKTFGDWAVGCDNARRCEAAALAPDGEDRATYLMLVVRREAAGPAKASLVVPLDAVAPGSRAMLKVDARPVAQLVAPSPRGGLALPLDRRLVSALTGGRTAYLLSADGKVVARASLVGLSAALSYIDAQQHRGRTVGALQQTGARSDRTVPPPPALPAIATPPSTDRPPRKLSPKAAARLIGGEARCSGRKLRVSAEAGRLDDGHSLALVPHPCASGPYTAVASLYVLDERGRATPADVERPGGPRDQPANVLFKPRWDPARRQIVETMDGRGLDNCGQRNTFAWDGARFRLAEAAAMAECHGAAGVITTWRATVVAR